MGRQWNTIIESLGPLSGGTGLSINANLTEIEALLTTLQADVADGINLTPNAFIGIASDAAGLEPIYGVQIGYYDSGAGEYRLVGDGSGLPISGAVTATPTRGTTTTGTLTAGTTNGTLFAANANRNYLCVQCTSGTVFIDTNGTASATDDIQLTSGQGITWEGSFIPTGAIAAITSTGTARIVGIQG